MSFTLHATMLHIAHTGVLLTGAAGIGKSEAALELLDRGHQLIADDSVILRKVEQKIVASCPQQSQRFLLVRELGMLNITKRYGERAFLAEYNLDLIIHLKKTMRHDAVSINPIYSYRKMLNVIIPQIQLTIHPQRNLPLLIETLVINFKLKKQSYEAATAFIGKCE